MAGSYKHIVNDNGNLRSNQAVADMLENGGDVFECVEEMYGMIWYLAQEVSYHAGDVGLDTKSLVENARQNYKEGLTIAKGTNGGG